MHYDEILRGLIDTTTFSVLDVETTGLSPEYNRIIEIAIVKVKNGEITDSYNTLINPGKRIPPSITELTGISDDDIEDAPFFADVVDEVTAFLDGTVFVAHNASFDIGFMKAELYRCGVESFQPVNVCTVRLARRIYPELRSKSLASVAMHLNIKNESAHRALSDAKATARIFIKMLLELKERFGFGELQELLSFQYNPVSSVTKSVLNKKFQNDFTKIPDAPGVYYFLNGKDEIIYVGKAKSLRKRIKTYLLDAAPAKSRKIVKQAKRIKTEITNSEVTALLAEAELIKKIDPKHNVQLKKYGSKYFLRFLTTELYPHIEITNKFDFDGNDYFGLFISRKKAVQVKEIIDKSFLLRECSEKEFKNNARCLMAHIERCTAPCKNNDSSLYEGELERVYEFLRGDHKTVLNRLILKMKKFSDEERFEQAAEMKTLVDLILNQVHKSSLLREPINKANVLMEISAPQGYRDHILMLEGKIFIKSYLLDGTDGFDSAVDDFFHNTLRLDYLPTKEDFEKMKIILNWIIKNRNSVRIFYLEDYDDREQLFSEVSKYNSFRKADRYISFDIKDFIAD